MPRQRTFEQRYKDLMRHAEWDVWSTYIKKVKKSFCQMIRAEYGAVDRDEPAVVNGKIEYVHSPIGYCVCVTSGKVYPSAGDNVAGRLDTGHFKQSLRIVLEETNAHPQSKYNNRPLYGGSGETAFYQIYMEHRYGQDEIDRLMRIKHAKDWQPPSIDSLVRKRIEFEDRRDAAKAIIEAGSCSSTA